MAVLSHESAFPRLTPDEIEIIRSLGERRVYRDGETVFKAGDADIDFFVVESGAIDVLNPTDHSRLVITHTAGEFAGDIDLITRRPVIVTAIAKGEETALLCVKGSELRKLINSVPKLGEKLMVAFTVRRDLLKQAGVAGLIVVGDLKDVESSLLREFLHKNFVPFHWQDRDSDSGRAELARMGHTPDDCPVIDCGNNLILSNPSISELAKCAGVTRGCPDRIYDLAIIGAGPAGMTAAVYAASEGLSTVILDRLGPGGQAAGSSLIENFIGFPSGLSGTELATRSVIQLLKFGALLLSPVEVRSIHSKDGLHTLISDDQEVQARAVLVATGAKWRKLDAKNAARFDRAGIYYAATAIESRICVGGQAAVVGGGNSSGQAAMYLSECAEKVHMFIRGDSLENGMSAYLAKRIRQNPRIEVHLQSEVQEVYGDEALQGVNVKDGVSGKFSRFDCAAMYVFIGAEPITRFLPPELARDEEGYILTANDAVKARLWKHDREPLPLESTIPGIFAAGDVRMGSTKRVAFAVGDGAMAVTAIHRYRGME